MHHVARQLRVHTRMHALCTFPLFLFLFFFLSHSLRTPRFSNRETWNEPNFLCFSEAISKSSNLFRSSKEPKDRNIFFLNRTRFCVAQDLFNKSDARVACILYVFQDFESISFVERNKNDKETNIFKSQREEYIIRLRTKFFSQYIFQRVDRILSWYFFNYTRKAYDELSKSFDHEIQDINVFRRYSSPSRIPFITGHVSQNRRIWHDDSLTTGVVTGPDSGSFTNRIS